MIISVYLFNVKMRPSIVKITQSYAKNEILQAVDVEVRRVMLEEFFSYDEIVVIERDNQGRVTSVSSNTTKINKFTNDLGLEIGNILDELSLVENKIHLSNLLGVDILAGTGPKIPIRFQPLSITNADISHSFEEAGINQTLHTINLIVSVEMEILLPLAHSSFTIESAMPIAQTLIVGTVPEAYLNRK